MDRIDVEDNADMQLMLLLLYIGVRQVLNIDSLKVSKEV
jgi:hypothetical protein